MKPTIDLMLLSGVTRRAGAKAPALLPFPYLSELFHIYQIVHDWPKCHEMPTRRKPFICRTMRIVKGFRDPSVLSSCT